MLEAPADAARPAESLWRHADFLKLWSAQTISSAGDQFTNLAIPLIATLTLGASARQMGLLAAMGTAPFLLVSLFAGIWVDRLPRRPILIISDVGRALILISIPLVALTHAIRMPQLYLVEFLTGVLSVFFETSYQAFLPSLVGKQFLVEGNSKLAATSSLAGLVGPSLAGFVIQYVSAPFAIVLDAVSFLFSGGLIGLIRRHETKQVKADRAPMLKEVREGIGFVFGNPFLRSIAGCNATFNFFYMAMSALYILFATRELGLSPSRIGLIFGLGNVAGLLGAVGASWLSKKIGLGPTLAGSQAISAISMLPIAFATPATAFGLLLLARAILNAFSSDI